MIQPYMEPWEKELNAHVIRNIEIKVSKLRERKTHRNLENAIFLHFSYIIFLVPLVCLYFCNNFG